MLQILRAHDILKRIVQAIGLMYDGTPILTPNGNTDYLEIFGILQSDMVAPVLFAIVLDYTMRSVINVEEKELGFKLDQRRGKHHNSTGVIDIDFTDDNVLVREKISQTQELII